MADTTYTSGVTVITADTMNDLNRLHYTIFSDPADLAAVKATLHAAPGAIGRTTPAAGTFTALVATGNVSLGDAGDTITFHGTPAGKVVGGTYSPTVDNLAGGAASALVGDAKANYRRVGDQVFVSALITLDSMANAKSSATIDLPIAATFSSGGDDVYGGVVTAVDLVSTSSFSNGVALSTPSSSTVTFHWGAINASAQYVALNFSYFV